MYLLSAQRCQISSLQIIRKCIVSTTNYKTISSAYIFRPHLPISSQVQTFKESFPQTSSAYLLRPHLPTSSQVRPFWETFPHVRPLFYEKDGLSKKDYEIVYHAKMFNYAFYAQMISLSTFSIQLVFGLYYAYSSYVAEKVVQMATNVGPFVINYDLQTLIIISILSFQNLLMFIAAQTACFRIYYCEESDKFVLISLAKNPFKSKVIYCRPGELVPLKTSLLTFVFGNHILNGKRLFISNANFKYPHMYNQMVGYNSE